MAVKVLKVPRISARPVLYFAALKRYRYAKHDPPMRLYFDDTIRYVFDHAFGGDEWNSGSGITDIYFPGADTVGLQSFKKVPYATVHFSASRMEASYGPDYAYTIASLCVPAKVVFDLP